MRLLDYDFIGEDVTRLSRCGVPGRQWTRVGDNDAEIAGVESPCLNGGILVLFLAFEVFEIDGVLF